MTQDRPGAAPTAVEVQKLVEGFKARTAFAQHIHSQLEEVAPGRAVVSIDIQDIHLNANGTVHGGVYAALIDTAMGIAVGALVRVRIATTQMNVHFLGPVRSGRVVCRGEVVHRTRRTATTEARVHDAAGELVAVGTGAFRIFEQRGDLII